MTYVDAYLLPVPEGKMDTYRAMATQAGEIWKEYGALSYKECVLDDDNIESLASFSRIAGTKPGEKTIIAFVVFNSRAHRDEVNGKVMKDERLKASCNENNMPFEMHRMAFGGFAPIVDL